MKFLVPERLSVHLLYPKEGCLADFELIESLREKFAFSPDEITNLKIKQEGQSFTWDIKVDGEGKEIDLNEKEILAIRKIINLLDLEKKITIELYPLCKKLLSVPLKMAGEANLKIPALKKTGV